MPRVSPAILRRAANIDRLLPQLLPVCRDLRLAQNELRWLREHTKGSGKVVSNVEWLVARRARGEPLQYILGSEYFGDLEITCRPGVLIPRPETAASVQYLVRRIRPFSNLQVLDLCTGSGCIPLLFHHEYTSRSDVHASPLRILGVDIAREAIDLANANLHYQQARRASVFRDISFVQADIFDMGQLHEAIADSKFDILISNPPYISRKGYRTTTARSVRAFEPKLALVPERHHHTNNTDDGDAFYPRLLDVADKASASVLLFEVGDLDQARRVATLIATRRPTISVEIWLDDPQAPDHSSEVIEGQEILIRGRGHGRTVFAYRKSSSKIVTEPHNVS